MQLLNSKSWVLFFFLVQIVSAVLAMATDFLIYKIGVAAIGTIILLVIYSKKLTQILDVWVVILAFICSMIGDYFLSNMNGDNAMFMIGILFYFIAHLGYLFFSLLNGSLKWRTTMALLLAFIIFYYSTLYLNITDSLLANIVLVYLVVSCISFGAALGIRSVPNVKWPFAIGIALILISDTIISFKEFMDYDALNIFILPTYYLAQIGITIALYNKGTLHFK